MNYTVQDVQDGVQDVQDWLMKIRYMNELIDAKVAERDQLMSLATKITPEMSGMPHGSGTSDKVGNIAVKLVDLARETNELIDSMVEHKQKVLAAMQKLDSVEYLVIYKYYIQGMTLAKIAEDLNYHRVSISNIKKKALEHLKDATQFY